MKDKSGGSSLSSLLSFAFSPLPFPWLPDDKSFILEVALPKEGLSVGQDRIAFTPQNGEFSVTQGRSSTLFGTRRVLERRVVNYRDKNNESQDKVVTRVEVVLTNRGAQAAEAFVREGIERYDDNQWKIIESTPVEGERPAANTVQFKLNVPAGGKVTLIYVVECE